MRKKVSTDLRGKIAVDRKVIPFQQVADHASGDQSTDVRGIHDCLAVPHGEVRACLCGPFCTRQPSWICTPACRIRRASRNNSLPRGEIKGDDAALRTYYWSSLETSIGD